MGREIPEFLCLAALCRDNQDRMCIGGDVDILRATFVIHKWDEGDAIQYKARPPAMLFAVSARGECKHALLMGACCTNILMNLVELSLGAWPPGSWTLWASNGDRSTLPALRRLPTEYIQERFEERSRLFPFNRSVDQHNESPKPSPNDLFSSHRN